MKEYLEQEVRHLNRLSEAVDNLIVSIQFSGSSVRQDADRMALYNAIIALIDDGDAMEARHNLMWDRGWDESCEPVETDRSL